MAFELYKDRTLKKGQKVRVYKNLNKDCYSITDYRSRLVVAYADFVTLSQVSFQIMKSGQRVCRLDGVRNVHAFAVGTFLDAEPLRRYSLWEEFTYNPFQNDHFVDRMTGLSIHEAAKVHMKKGKYFYRNH